MQDHVPVATILPESLMTDPVPADDATLFPKTAGERLREAREAQGLSLAEIAARTRVPLRQLEAIEINNFDGLPSVTYAVGFAKAYARAVGVDEVSIARDVRGQNDLGVRRTEYEQYEIKEPSRTPSGGVVIAALAAVVLLLIAVGLWYGTSLFRGGDDAAPAPVANEIAVTDTAPVAAPAAPQGGQVVLTATDEVWLKVYDGADKTLYIGTLAPGEAYTVPDDAVGPMINVGRPDKLRVTVGGQPIAPLGDGKRAIKDVKVDPAALIARGQPAPAATDAPAASAGGARGGPATGGALNIAAPSTTNPEPAALTGGNRAAQ